MNMASFLLAAYRRSVFFSIFAFFAFLAPSLALAQDFSGDGPFEISTEAELRAFATAVNGGNDFSGKTVKLTADIELTSAWTPIGVYSSNNANNKPFQGIFDGNGKVLDNVSVTSTDDGIGLFGTIGANGVVKDLGVINSSITNTATNSWYSGGLVGYNTGTIENSYFKGSVKASDGGRIGGLAGYNLGTISDSYSEGTVEGNRDQIGGLAGGNLGGTISGSYSKGTVRAIGTSSDGTGGLVGFNTSSSSTSILGSIINSFSTSAVSGISNTGGLVGDNNPGKISGSFSTGDVTATGTGTRIGGLVGRSNTNSTIDNSYSTGNVSKTGTDNGTTTAGTGGFVGRSNAPITNSYSTGSVDATTASTYLGAFVGSAGGASTVGNSYYDKDANDKTATNGGVGKSTAEMKIQGTFSTWDFDDIWGIDNRINDGYPHLLWSAKALCESGGYVHGEDGFCKTAAEMAAEEEAARRAACEAEEGNVWENGECKEPDEEPCTGNECEPSNIRLSQIADSQINIRTTANAIMLSNLPQNAKVEAYNLQGKLVYSAGFSRAGSATIPVRTKGVYVIKTGTEIFRVAVK